MTVEGYDWWHGGQYRERERRVGCYDGRCVVRFHFLLMPISFGMQVACSQALYVIM